jgi:hypothetical protein
VMNPVTLSITLTWIRWSMIDAMIHFGYRMRFGFRFGFCDVSDLLMRAREAFRKFIVTRNSYGIHKHTAKTFINYHSK